MPRTIVPPPIPSGLRHTTRESTGSTAARPDTLPEKLIKYVPAETLAFFIPAAALVGRENRGVLIATLIAAAIGSVGYLWLNARSLSAKERPLPHFYVLSVLALAAWALATSANVAALAGADEQTAGFVLLAAVFLIPLADGILTSLSRRDSMG